MASVWDTEFTNRGAPDNGSKYYYDYSDPTNYRSSYGTAFSGCHRWAHWFFSLAKPVKIYEGDDEEFFIYHW